MTKRENLLKGIRSREMQGWNAFEETNNTVNCSRREEKRRVWEKFVDLVVECGGKWLLMASTLSVS